MPWTDSASHSPSPPPQKPKTPAWFAARVFWELRAYIRPAILTQGEYQVDVTELRPGYVNAVALRRTFITLLGGAVAAEPGVDLVDRMASDPQRN